MVFHKKKTKKRKGDNQNEILFIMDSIGYESFSKAETPNLHHLSSYGPIKAFSSGTWTAPSFHAMLSGDGAVPQPVEKVFTPYRIGDLFIRWVPSRYNDMGYNTYLITANPLIHRSGYKDLLFTKYYFNMEKSISADKLIDFFLTNYQEPFFAVFLFIETHYPYMYNDGDFTRASQIKAIKFLDDRLKHLYDNLPLNTRIIVTSDHADLWERSADGTDGDFLGHNPFQPKIVQSGRLHELLEVFLSTINR